jgi:hypothetical protein
MAPAAASLGFNQEISMRRVWETLDNPSERKNKASPHWWGLSIKHLQCNTILYTFKNDI